jgi:hypothetical protein
MTPQEMLKKAADALQKAAEEKNKRKLDEDRKFILAGIAKDLTSALTPTLERIAENSKINKREIETAVSSAIQSTRLSVDVPAPVVNVPDVYVPDFKIPTPIVNYTPPAIHIPDIKMPAEMQVKGAVELANIGLANPLPVQLRDADGSPVKLFENLTQIVGGGGARRVKIDNTSSEPIPVTGTISASFAADYGEGEVGTETLRVVQATNALSSVSVKDIFGSTCADLVNPDGRLKVEMPAGASGLSDAELRASSVPVSQVSGSRWSTEAALYASDGTALNHSGGNLLVDVQNFAVGQFGNSDDTAANLTSALTFAELLGYDSVSGNWDRVRMNEGEKAGAIRVVQATDAIASVNVVSGTVTVLGITNTVAASIIDSTGVQYSGSNPIPVQSVFGTIGHGVKTVTTAGTDVALAASTTCKRVTVQAQTDNTGLIAVGASGVDATEATGTGIILYAGDSVELDIDNLADIYIDSTVDGEGVRYIYLT